MAAYGEDFEKLNDGQWHWVRSGPELGLRAHRKNELWVCETPSEPGYFPADREKFVSLDYYPEADDFVFMGTDMYANNGQAAFWGEYAPAVVMPWPMPEFMDKQENDWFMRLWTPEEQDVGHFHFPDFYVIKQGTLKALAQQRAGFQTPQ